ncbi:hypothetical protein Tco_0416832, partial [Tanacetum coccineum]
VFLLLELVVDFPFEDILLSKDASSVSDDDEISKTFCKDLLAKLFIKCLSARGNCNQKYASEVPPNISAATPNIAAAKENLAAEPLSSMVAYCRTLSSSSMEPDVTKYKIRKAEL